MSAKKSINFSDSYAKSKQAIIVKDDSSIKKVDDLYGDNAYRVGVQLSTTGAIYFGDDIEKKKTNATLHEYHNGADAVAALIAGKIDCVIIDEQPAKSFVASNRGLEILATEYVEEEYAIIVSKEKEELLKKINSIIEMFATEQPKVYHLIENSFLEDKVKRMYKQSYQERLRLFQRSDK